MKSLTVQTGRSYQIFISRGLLGSCGAYIKNAAGRAQKAMVISDSNVFPLYGGQVTASLKESGLDVYTHVFLAGEQSKRLACVEEMYRVLAEHYFSRSDLIVALGGGVVGDMAGFAAATYQRGIRFVQLPTSLLAQVDSSVGGKTGVDIEQGKNLVGAFWQPSLVLIDPQVLETLPEKFFCDGMAEVIKYGCIKSLSLFEQLENKPIEKILDDVIFSCVDIKRKIVENDEREAGERMLLNFGHTLGHSLERAYGYQGITHGQAVAVGMALLTGASERAGLTKVGTQKRLCALLQKYELPVSDPTDLQTIVNGALTDKKSSGDSISIVLLNEIGKSFTKKMKKENLYAFCK
ncbi:MAG TPA: 3-dehydroquinate synthase [Candidatus Scatovicinus merdipullorum]|nr:3-dehydroquinate synthase [Candidatus Scatovicinus merdipullorum]